MQQRVRFQFSYKRIKLINQIWNHTLSCALEISYDRRPKTIIMWHNVLGSQDHRINLKRVDQQGFPKHLQGRVFSPKLLNESYYEKSSCHFNIEPIWFLVFISITKALVTYSRCLYFHFAAPFYLGVYLQKIFEIQCYFLIDKAGIFL